MKTRKWTPESILKELQYIEGFSTDTDFGTFDEKIFSRNVLVFIEKLKKDLKREEARNK